MSRQQGSDASDWQEDKQMHDVSVKNLQLMVKEMRELRAEYDELKKLSNKAYEKYKEKEGLVLQAFENSGLSKFNVPGLGTAYTINKYRVTVPKDTNSKRKLFGFIKDRYGDDVASEFTTINHNTLNAFYKSEIEAALERGDSNFKVPGLEDPVHEVSMGFRRETKGE
jgi:hypothetical protein